VESFKTTSDEILVTVRGYSTRTGQAVTHTGTVANTIYADDSGGSEDPLSNLYIHASFILETDSDVFSVGGYGAVKEDIRATLIEIEAV